MVQHMMKTKTALAMSSLALIVALTGCGSSSADSKAAPSKNAEDQGVKYAQCMRKHGVPMEDPKPGEQGTLQLTKDSADKTTAAMGACKEFSPMQNRVKLSQEDIDKQMKLAKCMRSHGVNMKDPKPDGSRTEALESTPKNLAASRACAAEVGLPGPGAAAPGPAAPGAAVAGQ
jgi:hypothetical protein